MLKSIQMTNFRSCHDLEVMLDRPVVCLVGKNGVGKTSILQAIQLIASIGSSNSAGEFVSRPRFHDKPSRLSLSFSLESSSYQFTTTRLSRTDRAPRRHTWSAEESLQKDGEFIYSRRDDEVNCRGMGDLRLGTRAPTIPSLLQLLPEDHATFSELKGVREFFRSIRYYPLLQDSPQHTTRMARARLRHSSDSPQFIRSHSYDAWKATRDPGHGDPVLLRLLHLHLEDSERFNEIKSLIGESGLELIHDIQIDTVPVPTVSIGASVDDTPETLYVIRFMPCSSLAGAGGWFDFTGLSSGTWRILQMVTYLIFDSSSCMLLEQPEDSIHPGLLSRVIAILTSYSGRTQLVCTTHSPQVMNLAGPNAVRLVSADNGVTSVRNLSSEQLAAVSRYLSDEGTLAEYLELIEG